MTTVLSAAKESREARRAESETMTTVLSAAKESREARREELEK